MTESAVRWKRVAAPRPGAPGATSGGFPGFAVRETFSAKSLRRFIEPLSQIAVEPTSPTTTPPKAQQVFLSRDRGQRAGPESAPPEEVSFGAFLVQFLTTWILVWVVVNGPMRVPFIRWRFRGERLV